MSTTPISRKEQIVAIRTTAKEHKSVINISACATEYVVVSNDQSDASDLCNRFRAQGWYRTTMGIGQYTKHWYIRVPFNPVEQVKE